MFAKNLDLLFISIESNYEDVFQETASLINQFIAQIKREYKAFRILKQKFEGNYLKKISKIPGFTN